MHPAAFGDELVNSSASGDPAAQARLFELLTPAVRIMVNARLNPTVAQTHIAEDLVQESLLALRQSIGALQRRTAAGLRAFASAIVSNHVADALRDHQRMAARGGRSLDTSVRAGDSGVGPLWAVLSSSGASPLTQANHNELVPRIMGAINELKPEHREVITLAFFDQLDTRALAERMGISRPAASMLLIRAIKSLRRQLTGFSQVLESSDARER